MEGLRNASGSFGGYSVLFIEINTTCISSSVISRSVSSTSRYSITPFLTSTSHPVGSISTTATVTPSSSTTIPNSVTLFSLFQVLIIIAAAIFGVSCLILSTCAIILALVKRKMDGPSYQISGNKPQGKKW